MLKNNLILSEKPPPQRFDLSLQPVVLGSQSTLASFESVTFIFHLSLLWLRLHATLAGCFIVFDAQHKVASVFAGHMREVIDGRELGNKLLRRSSTFLLVGSVWWRRIEFRCWCFNWEVAVGWITSFRGSSANGFDILQVFGCWAFGRRCCRRRWFRFDLRFIFVACYVRSLDEAWHWLFFQRRQW